MRRNHVSPLTERERQVLKLIAEGRRNSDISQTLHIGIYTVQTHVSHILSKLDAKGRVEAAIYYTKHEAELQPSQSDDAKSRA